MIEMRQFVPQDDMISDDDTINASRVMCELTVNV